MRGGVNDDLGDSRHRHMMAAATPQDHMMFDPLGGDRTYSSDSESDEDSRYGNYFRYEEDESVFAHRSVDSVVRAHSLTLAVGCSNRVRPHGVVCFVELNAVVIVVVVVVVVWRLSDLLPSCTWCVRACARANETNDRFDYPKGRPANWMFMTTFAILFCQYLLLTFITPFFPRELASYTTVINSSTGNATTIAAAGADGVGVGVGAVVVVEVVATNITLGGFWTGLVFASGPIGLIVMIPIVPILLRVAGTKVVIEIGLLLAAIFLVRQLAACACVCTYCVCVLACSLWCSVNHLSLIHI